MNAFKKVFSTKKDSKTNESGKLDLAPSQTAGISSGATVSERTSEVALHPDAHEEGGLSCNNDELLRLQQKAIMEWIKSMGRRLLTGSLNLINTPFPVTMFEPRSYLEKLADVWVYPRYLSQAAVAVNPLERMKFVMTWFVAGLHHGFEKWKKPFNPILGETWEATLPDGSSMFMEQISHHPPVSAFHLEGPGNKYRFVGLSQPNVSLVVKHNGFKTVAKGLRYLEFADGTRIDIQYPAYVIRGVVYSNRPRAEVEGKAVFEDPKNGLKGIVKFGPVKGAKQLVLKRTDAVTGGIYDCGGTEGSYHRGNTAACDEASSGSNAGEGTDEFESASETEWDTREAGAAGIDPVGLLAAQLEGSTQQEKRTSATDGRLNTQASKSFNHTAGTPLSTPADATPKSSPIPSSSGAAAGDWPQQDSKSTSFSFGKMLGFSSASTILGGSADEPPPGPLLSSLEGSWLSHVDFDGQRYWSLAKEKPEKWQPVQNPLPSDARYRHDLAVLARGDLKQAQEWKEKLENLQRRDKKLRETNH
mmetsp:Transcript_35594/g.79082  ORF Transcript_35594/g.79082 Transcript_35594/m.79082 type:complete len:531 (+) Transcript_35594:289-1881(+)|eukprot:CAMPEP_0202908056 /NCGR_PEP_ID=MMETSP1392-20130828/44705_1 /ASSEMBLY_ACC=CAM_ASM_000868 /TAXON_ID=225041 /ORGANISM="Chlamydomonas chlamydogama, Strain SAG 11-48b" /LENGTH=530 /DNA_ID=CAMNT_0049597189 /DNA_START=238 /DNA_END=1830 /DNA_ORIENTATION=-